MRWRVLAADAADLNPIDPSAPDLGGPNFGDNAQNSVEQEVATQTWVDHALDLLSRGATQQEVVAKLAHDGCPDPEAVYERAMEHQAAQSNDFDPDVTEPTVAPEVEDQSSFDVPPAGVTASDGSTQAPNMGVQGVDDLKTRLAEAEAQGDTVAAQQIRNQIKTMWQGYTGSVRVANFEGAFRGMEFDEWGRLVVAVDTPQGVQQFNGEIAEPVSDTSDEVSEIQRFIDSIPEVTPNDLSSVVARIEGLKEAKAMILAALSQANSEDLAPLVAMRTATAGAIGQLEAHAANVVTEPEADYLAGRQQYEVGAVVAANGSVGGFDSPDLNQVVAEMVDSTSDYNPVKAVREDAEILVSELPELMVRDVEATADLAMATVVEKTAAMSADERQPLIDQFVDAVEKHRQIRESKIVAETNSRVASIDNVEPDNEGPAEGLFW